MKIRKLSALLLAFLLCFILAACQKDKTESKKSAEKISTSSLVNKDSSRDATTSDSFALDIDPSSSEKRQSSNNVGSDTSRKNSFSTPSVTIPSIIPPSQSQSKISPLLYKVTDSKGNVAWLFGSIHVGEDSFYPLPNYVTKAFNSADSLAVEFDVVAFEKDMSAQTVAIRKMLCPNGTTVKDYISEETYNKAVQILKASNMYSQIYDYYIPYFWGNLIDNIMYEKIGADSSKGIDRHMINMAYRQNKEVLDVESAEFQYGMMADFSYELQNMLLESSIEGYNDISTMSTELRSLMSAWSKGNEAEFVKLLESETDGMTAQELKLYEEYNNAVSVNRNLSMATYVEMALASGKEVFVCVGAAHIVGDGAMVQLLKSRGYKVELVR